MVQSTATVLYVNPTAGNDGNDGSQAAPFKTITKALQIAKTGNVIQLLAGTYNAASGEAFPLTVTNGVIIRGDEASKGNGILVNGGGRYLSPTFAGQNVTFRMENKSQLLGVTVTNLESRGTGVWIEGTDPTIGNCTFTNCKREGIFATGAAKPIVTDCAFVLNAANGISIVREAKGEFRRNVCQNTGFGISIGDNAAPLVVENRAFENRAGIVISRAARPVLRGNVVERNTESGLVALETAVPDLGNSQESGKNVFRDNGEVDLQNATNPPVSFVSVGNQLNPAKIQGPVELIGNEIPTPSPSPTPTPSPTPSPTPGPSPTPTPGPSPTPTPVPVPVPTPTPTPTPGPSPTPTPTPTPGPTPTPTPTPTGLTDIGNHWASAFIQALVGRNLLTGFPDGTFKPQAPLTRAQYAAILAKTFDLPAKRQSKTFSDVATGFWATEAIAKADRMGFISGFPDGTFRPGQNLTRVQAIVSLINGLGLTGGAITVLGAYDDRAQIPGYATEEVTTATQRRLVVNYPDTKKLDPNRDITRAEISALVYQALVAINRATVIASQYIVEPSASAISFTDIDSHWAKDFILAMAMQDLMRGNADGTFKPNDGMNRAQFSAVVARAFNPAPKRAAAAAIDVPGDHWAKAAIEQTYRGGFLDLLPDKTFKPNQALNRLQLIQAIVAGSGLTGGNVAALSRFRDRDSIPAAAQAAVATALQHRLLVNHPDVNLVDPNRAVTRAEVAAMVLQALVRSGRSVAVNSPFVVSA
jgi:parallel beta-helix repeat protein